MLRPFLLEESQKKYIESLFLKENSKIKVNENIIKNLTLSFESVESDEKPIFYNNDSDIVTLFKGIKKGVIKHLISFI